MILLNMKLRNTLYKSVFVYLGIIKIKVMEENVKLFLSISWEKIEYYYDDEE